MAAAATDAAPGEEAEADENCFLEEALARYAGDVSSAATTAF